MKLIIIFLIFMELINADENIEIEENTQIGLSQNILNRKIMI